MPFPQGSTEGPTLAGLDLMFFQNGRQVDYASSASIAEDTELQRVRTLGVHGDRHHKSGGYTVSVNVGTFLLRGQDIQGALITPIWDSTGTYFVNKSGEYDFTLADVITRTIMVTVIGCKVASRNLDIPQSGMSTAETVWWGRRAVPGLLATF